MASSSKKAEAAQQRNMESICYDGLCDINEWLQKYKPSEVKQDDGVGWISVNKQCKASNSYKGNTVSENVNEADKYESVHQEYCPETNARSWIDSVNDPTAHQNNMMFVSHFEKINPIDNLTSENSDNTIAAGVEIQSKDIFPTFQDMSELSRITAAQVDWGSLGDERTCQNVFDIAQRYNLTVGKWMIFIKSAKVDTTWSQLVLALLDDQLHSAISVKVSVKEESKSQHVIFVYTRNFFDSEEVKAIKERISQFHKYFYAYKPEIFSHLGIYSDNQWKITAKLYPPDVQEALLPAKDGKGKTKKERRRQIFQEQQKARNAQKEAVATGSSVTKEISEDNVGFKMLAKMGWKSGEGLGKNSSGITKPVLIDVRKKNEGLGCDTSNQTDKKKRSSKSKKKGSELSDERSNPAD